MAEVINMVTIKKIEKYLVNGFAYLITKNLKQYLDYDFYENFPKPSKFDILTNFWHYFFDQLK